MMDIIKQIRKATKFKQQNLAIMVGINQSNFSKMESGKLIQNNQDEILKDCINILLPEIEHTIEMYENKIHELRMLRTKSFKLL